MDPLNDVRCRINHSKIALNSGKKNLVSQEDEQFAYA